MTATTPSRDLTRTTLGVLFLVGLLLCSFWVLRPFLIPLVWATMLVIACWPLQGRLQQRLGNRRGPAVVVMMSVLLLVFLVPVALALGVLVTRAPDIVAWVKQQLQDGLPPPPDWVAKVPMFGKSLAATWSELATTGPQGLSARIAPHAEELASWFAKQVGSAGLLMLDFLLTLLIAGILFAKGDAFGDRVRHFAHRLAGDRGDRAAILAAQSVRAVAFGVVITALVQTAVGGLGLLIAGIPVPGLLTAIMFVASIAQLGAAPVLALAAVWLFTQGEVGWGVVMVVWTVVTGSLDNVIRPLLIRKGVNLPLLLVFAGVLGGLVAFGPVGLFAGPVVLAVGHTLLTAWIADDDGPLPASGSAAP